MPDQAPDAVQSVASLADHVSVLMLPAAMELGVTESETTGVGAVATVMVADCEVVPPAPLQTSV